VAEGRASAAERLASEQRAAAEAEAAARLAAAVEAARQPLRAALARERAVARQQAAAAEQAVTAAAGAGGRPEAAALQLQLQQAAEARAALQAELGEARRRGSAAEGQLPSLEAQLAALRAETVAAAAAHADADAAATADAAAAAAAEEEGGRLLRARVGVLEVELAEAREALRERAAAEAAQRRAFETDIVGLETVERTLTQRVAILEALQEATLVASRRAPSEEEGGGETAVASALTGTEAEAEVLAVVEGALMLVERGDMANAQAIVRARTTSSSSGSGSADDHGVLSGGGGGGGGGSGGVSPSGWRLLPGAAAPATAPAPPLPTNVSGTTQVRRPLRPFWRPL
jgi:hypothetical protein